VILPARRRGLWTAAAAVTLAATGLALVPLLARGAPLPGARGVVLHEVARGRFVRRVRAEGFLKAVKATPIAVPVRQVPVGYRVAWVAPDGARLRRGDPVVRFDPTELRTSLADSRADRTSAVRKADKTEALAEASRANLEDSAGIARREKEHAAAFVSEDAEIFSRSEIIESTIDRDLAATKASHAEEKIAATARRSSVELDLYHLQRGAADLKIRQAEEALDHLVVTAPHDGLLVLERNWRGETTRPGDTVWQGEKIGEIPEMGAMEAVVHVLEADAGGLAPGRRAEVRLAARPGEPFPGKVARVDALAKPLRRGLPVQYFETVVAIEPPEGTTLKPGQRVTAEIVLEEVEDALAVPRQAVFEKDGRKVVWREEGGGLRPVEVKVGRYGLGSVLIEEGLAEGDRIALRDPSLAASEIAAPAGGAARRETSP
jgi:multidrug resistance efflux pump